MGLLCGVFIATVIVIFSVMATDLADFGNTKDSAEPDLEESLFEPRADVYNATITGASKPNILVFIADDLGHADLSYSEGNLQTPTPNIDKLAWDGIILNRHYVNPICTPTRGAFMTGRDAFRVGLQTAAISEGEPWGLPLQFKIQPQYFKDLGYTTAAVGKWHLGMYTRQHFPNARGFDYSYWFHGGDANWFNVSTGWLTPVLNHGKAFRENGKIIFSNITNNYYFPEQMTAKAEQIIHDFEPNKPWYLYFATPVTHTAIAAYGPEQHVMASYQLRPPVRSFSNQFPERKKQLGIIQVLDEQFRRLTNALTYTGAINNTIIVFMADNGGPLPEVAGFIHGSNHASNWPLRLGKGSLFEGGVRGLSFIWSPLLKRRGRVTNQLFHVSDWLPTLYEAAGGNVRDLVNVTGVSQWKSLFHGNNYGPRTELVNNIDSILNQYAMVYQDQYGGMYKLIGGNVFNNQFFGWDRTEGTSPGNEMKSWSPVSVECNFPDGMEVSTCRPYQSDCLFDLINDPCETNNIAASFPSMTQLLQQKIKNYNGSSFPAQVRPFDPASNPDLHQGLWTPWLDPVEVLDTVPLTFQTFTPTNTL
ncbi:arylsulfatase B-like [Paramacrobiotus metropolitanus]|uniref:arylsulfatase B-like n=1 Tax=Paramacrobiotus metropolitanus TaxID=2943436 RepID=UPI0024458493|nr:arylsulfatase B-like [Paramacrobiotus metropolitanus]